MFIFPQGNLRPYPQSSTRTVPVHIPRPDYADHFKGHPVSEQKNKSSTQIKVLNEEEIEEMRVACKVNFISKIEFGYQIFQLIGLSCKVANELSLNLLN